MNLIDCEFYWVKMDINGTGPWEPLEYDESENGFWMEEFDRCVDIKFFSVIGPRAVDPDEMVKKVEDDKSLMIELREILKSHGTLYEHRIQQLQEKIDEANMFIKQKENK